jgi:hypothetical protein
VFFPGKLSQPGVMFAGKPILVEHLSGTQLIGRFLASLVNIRLDWEGLIETNTLAF